MANEVKVNKFERQHARARRRLAALPAGSFTVTRPLIAAHVAREEASRG